MPKIRKVTNHGKKKYEIDFGRVAGKRRRRFVDTKGEASAALKKMTADRIALGDAWDDLESRKKWTILEVLREIDEAGLSLPEVWDGYQKAHMVQSGCTIETAVTEFLEIKKGKGWRERYANEMTRTLFRFAQGREKRLISSVDHGELEGWISGFKGSDATRKTMHARIGILFAWAERQGYIRVNPMKRIETIRLDQAEPEILTVDQCRRLIASCQAIDPDLLPYFALSLFLGVRPEECMRLKPDAVDLDRGQITISGETSKTRNRRIITILDPARRILVKHKVGKFSTNFRRRRDAVRKHAKIKKWPKDVLRHTAASHFYNIYGMDEATKQLGHSAAIMLRHYRQMVSKEDTEAWLGI